MAVTVDAVIAGYIEMRSEIAAIEADQGEDQEDRSVVAAEVRRDGRAVVQDSKRHGLLQRGPHGWRR